MSTTRPSRRPRVLHPPRRLPDALSALAAKVWRGHGVPALVDGLPVQLGTIPAAARPDALAALAVVLQDATAATVARVAAGDLRGATPVALARAPVPQPVTAEVRFLVAISHHAGRLLADLLTDPALVAAVSAGDRRPLEALRGPGARLALEAAVHEWSEAAAREPTTLTPAATQRCRAAIAHAMAPYLPPLAADPADDDPVTAALLRHLSQVPPVPSSPARSARLFAQALATAAVCVQQQGTGRAAPCSPRSRPPCLLRPVSGWRTVHAPRAPRPSACSRPIRRSLAERRRPPPP